jgi:hypothetical protein
LKQDVSKAANYRKALVSKLPGLVVPEVKPQAEAGHLLRFVTLPSQHGAKMQ